MLIPSKKIFYAVEAVLYIAYNAKTNPISGSEIAEAQDLPTRYLEPMMQKLVRSGILKGVRGPQGGYLLGRERRRITLAEICDALAEDADFPKSNTALGNEVLSSSARALMESWKGQLGNLNIAILCERATAANIPSTQDIAHDFTI